MTYQTCDINGCSSITNITIYPICDSNQVFNGTNCVCKPYTPSLTLTCLSTDDKLSFNAATTGKQNLTTCLYDLTFNCSNPGYITNTTIASCGNDQTCSPPLGNLTISPIPCPGNQVFNGTVCACSFSPINTTNISPCDVANSNTTITVTPNIQYNYTDCSTSIFFTCSAVGYNSKTVSQTCYFNGTCSSLPTVNTLVPIKCAGNQNYNTFNNSCECKTFTTPNCIDSVTGAVVGKAIALPLDPNSPIQLVSPSNNPDFLTNTVAYYTYNGDFNQFGNILSDGCTSAYICSIDDYLFNSAFAICKNSTNCSPPTNFAIEACPQYQVRNSSALYISNCECKSANPNSNFTCQVIGDNTIPVTKQVINNIDANCVNTLTYSCQGYGYSPVLATQICDANAICSPSSINIPIIIRCPGLEFINPSTGTCGCPVVLPSTVLCIFSDNSSPAFNSTITTNIDSNCTTKFTYSCPNYYLYSSTILNQTCDAKGVCSQLSSPQILLSKNIHPTIYQCGNCISNTGSTLGTQICKKTYLFSNPIINNPLCLTGNQANQFIQTITQTCTPS
jgi:hypothetical protein